MSKEDIQQYKFKQGQSGNPKGRPKGVPNTKTRLQRMLSLEQEMTNPVTNEKELFSVAEQMDLALIKKARQGDVRAYKELMDRMEGTPMQKIQAEVTNNPARDVLEAAGLIGGEDDGQTPSNI